MLSAGVRLHLQSPGTDKIDGLCFLRLRGEPWCEVQLIIEHNKPDANSAQLTVCYRDLYDEDPDYTIVKNLEAIPLDLSDVPLDQWTGLRVQLRGPGAKLDDLEIYSVPSIAELPGKRIVRVKPPFSPILDHISSPRQALDINGEWEVAVCRDNPEQESADARWGKVMVPGDHFMTVRTALDTGQAWFRRKFVIPGSWQGKRVRMVFERIVEEADIYLNGRLVAQTQENFVPIRLDCTAAARIGAENTLLVNVRFTRSTTNDKRPGGSTYVQSNYDGIPCPVHIEGHGSIWVEKAYIDTRIEPERELEARVILRNDSSRDRLVHVTAGVLDEFFCRSDEVTVSAHGTRDVTIKSRWDSPRLWWPHDPHLYYLEVDVVSRENNVLDSYKERFGFRQVMIKGRHAYLNNRQFMHRRRDFISHWQHGFEGWFEDFIAKMRPRGYSGSRSHHGPNLRNFRKADEVGWLMCAEAAITGTDVKAPELADTFWPAAEDHLVSMVKEYYNHPSIVYWSICNEFGGFYVWLRNQETDREDFIPWLNDWLDRVGKEVMEIDRTRFITYEGEQDLSVKNVVPRGRAPNFNFHYPWQPFKLQNMMPTTAYWLEERLKPWQRVTWDGIKPVIIGEDLYPGYSHKVPHGLTQWAGDLAYDQQYGAEKAIFDSFRMFVDGYYHFGLAAWTDWWGRGHRFGQTFPDYWVATHRFNCTFSSGAKAERTVHVYNQLFADEDCVLTLDLLDDGRPVDQQKREFKLLAGERRTFGVLLHMPATDEVKSLVWHLQLRVGDRLLAARQYDYTVFPQEPDFETDRRIAVVIPSNDPAVADGLRALNIGEPYYEDLGSALAARPDGLILAEVSLSEAVDLEQAVINGLDVLWLEPPVESWLPSDLRMDGRHRAAHAFVRSPNDEIVKDMSEDFLRSWRPAGHMTANTFHKPKEGSFDILLDCGSSTGMGYTPLLRTYRGSGSYLLCQLPVLSASAEEPAAGHVLSRLFSGFVRTDRPMAQELYLLADEDSSLARFLTSLGIDYTLADLDDDNNGLLLVGKTDPHLSDEELDLIEAHLAGGRTVWMQGIDQAMADGLSGILEGTIKVVPCRNNDQMFRSTNRKLMDGLSNDDLYWMRGEKYRQKKAPPKKRVLVSEITYEGEQVYEKLTTPAGLARISAPGTGGSTIFCQVDWTVLSGVFPDKASRMMLTLLANQGIRPRGELAETVFDPVDLNSVVNRGFHHHPRDEPTGWFGDEDDMRYFPVNRTGLGIVDKVAVPLEPFPEEDIVLGAIPFKIIDPERNRGRSCLILGGRNDDGLIRAAVVSVNKKADRLWMLGAISGMGGTRPVVRVDFRYADGATDSADIVAGVHVNGFQYHDERLRQGVVGWSGYSGARPDAVLYVWDVENPQPENHVSDMQFQTTGNHGFALVGLTVERVVDQDQEQP